MEILIEAVKQVPALSVLAFVVWIFLKEMKSITGKLSETLKQTAGECHIIQKEAIKIISRTNGVLERIEPKLDILDLKAREN